MSDIQDALILGIETSCDETAAAVIRGGRHILSNVVASQEEIHRKYGGVFPEIASRQHVVTIMPVIEEAMQQAGIHYGDLAGIAVTYGPGLAGSLLVGVNVAKGLAFSQGLPLIGINHLEGHIYSNWIRGARPAQPGHGAEQDPEFPLLCLIVSGGHTELILMHDHGEYQRLGQTLDDAAGEAFDKVGRLLGVGYPGGPAIQRAAQGGDPALFAFPRAWLPNTFDFSFSGLKTAVRRVVEQGNVLAGRAGGYTRTASGPGRKTPDQVDSSTIADIAASFQEAVTDVLSRKTAKAAEQYQVRYVLLAGGVAANLSLRQHLAERVPCPVRFPPLWLCTDNGTMIASAGYFHWMKGEFSGWDLDVVPSLTLI
ncbi:MAG: tRNA (adenosine(37)-N6)-threonylcarbamoyltransferase complex transferase subunit TsaD [Chloroflexi bacterium]|nr:tRNA (adenosine(37)-N6)-threonylcarbamoyltransferase complex transferase subunit TsaD [Chloroflexota bacterium]